MHSLLYLSVCRTDQIIFFPPTAHGSVWGQTCAHRQNACCANEGADARGRDSPGPRCRRNREGRGVGHSRNVSSRRRWNQ